MVDGLINLQFYVDSTDEVDTSKAIRMGHLLQEYLQLDDLRDCQIVVATGDSEYPFVPVRAVTHNKEGQLVLEL